MMKKQIYVELIEVLKKEQALLDEALSITMSVTSLLVNDSSIDELSAMIQSRQESIVKIEELNREFSKLKEQVADEDYKEQIDIIDLKTKIKNTLQSIINEDTGNKDIAEEKLKVCSAQIRNLSQAKKGIDSYANTFKPEDGVYIDAKK